MCRYIRYLYDVFTYIYIVHRHVIMIITFYGIYTLFPQGSDNPSSAKREQLLGRPGQSSSGEVLPKGNRGASVAARLLSASLLTV